MRIGELATRSGLSTKTIRYYEGIGLIPEPPRTDVGYRNYDSGAVERLRFITDAQTTGLSLTEIASVLELKDANAPSCEHTRELLEFQLAEIERRIAALESTRRELQELIVRAGTLDPSGCSDPHRCQVVGDGIASRLDNALDPPRTAP